MKSDRSRIGCAFALGVAVLVASEGRPAVAGERVTAMQPFSASAAPPTRLLGAAPLKPPILFADDDEAVAAKMETVGWYRYGAPTYAYYRGYGGWYGPWYGYRSYPYWGGYYGGYYGFYGSPFGYYGAYNPIGFSYSGVGYRPWAAYPTVGFYPPYYGGGAGYYPYPNYGFANYGGYGLANYGGCCYW
ncbi:MAG TPA: hypothetical protein VHY91_12730 [Pirellulales bacterium]|jgi:hypothetical protein|nr:hypothetical protein [Pirellulales bacterium]